MGGKSVDYDQSPKSNKIVRAINGPGCQTVTPCKDDENSCIFVWLMDCEYKGWIPTTILEMALPTAQFQYVESIRELATNL